MGPGDLTKIMKNLKIKKDKRVIIGAENADDSAVVMVGKEKILQTADIITPIVEDPFIFGQIAAANALSDVYAMGGKPVSVLNIACFPVDCLDLKILEDIFLGGLSKIEEAGACLVGGHTVIDKEIKYGLSVVGISGENIFHNALAKEGLDIILTKPLGGGIVSTALKAEMVEKEHRTEMLNFMTRLNKYSAEVAEKTGIITMTDITGFGLLGHLLEVLKASNISARIYKEKVPFMSGFDLYISYGLIPAGAYRNKEFVENYTNGEKEWVLKLSAPETSGGLLIFCEKNKTERILSNIKENGDPMASFIGETIKLEESHIYLV